MAVTNDPDIIRGYIPIEIPRVQLTEFVRLITGDDNDVILAAEYALNKPFDAVKSYGDGRIELGYLTIPGYGRIDQFFTDPPTGDCDLCGEPCDNGEECGCHPAGIHCPGEDF